MCDSLDHRMVNPMQRVVCHDEHRTINVCVPICVVSSVSGSQVEPFGDEWASRLCRVDGVVIGAFGTFDDDFVAAVIERVGKGVGEHHRYGCVRSSVDQQNVEFGTFVSIFDRIGLHPPRWVGVVRSE